MNNRMNENTLFIDTNLDTHLALVVSDSDTVNDLKRKIMQEHSLCFPDLGQIEILAVKVKRREYYYHLTDHMRVKPVFAGVERSWFLYVDASRNVHVAGASNLISDGTTKKLCLAADLKVKHVSDDQCKTSSCTSSQKVESGIQLKCQNGASDLHCNIPSKDYTQDVVDSKKKRKAKRKFEAVVDTLTLKVNDDPIDEFKLQAEPNDERLTENEVDGQPFRQNKRQKIKKRNIDSLNEKEALVDGKQETTTASKHQTGTTCDETSEAVNVPLGSTMDDKQATETVVQDTVSTVPIDGDTGHDSVSEKRKKKKQKKMEASSSYNDASAADPSPLEGIRQEISKEQLEMKDSEEINDEAVVQGKAELCLNSEEMQAVNLTLGSTMDDKQETKTAVQDSVSTVLIDGDSLIANNSVSEQTKMKKNKMEPSSTYNDAPAADPASVDGIRQESSKEQQQILHSDEKTDEAVVQGQSGFCLNSQEMGAANTTLGNTMDDKHETKTDGQDSVSTVPIDGDSLIANNSVSEKRKRKKKKQKEMEPSCSNNDVTAADPSSLKLVRQESSKEKMEIKDLDEKTDEAVVQGQSGICLNSEEMGAANTTLGSTMDDKQETKTDGQDSVSTVPIDGDSLIANNSVSEKRKRKKKKQKEMEPSSSNNDVTAANPSSLEVVRQESSKDKLEMKDLDEKTDEEVVQGQSGVCFNSEEMGAASLTLGSRMDDKQETKTVVQDTVSSGHIDGDTGNDSVSEKRKNKKKKQKKLEPSSCYNDASAADPCSMEGIRLEISKEQQEMKVSDEKTDDAVAQVQSVPCLNSQEMGSAGDVLMHEEDKHEPESQKYGKEMEPSQNIDGEVVPPESCEPIDKGKTEVAISSKVLVNDEVVEPVKSIGGEKKSKKRRKKDGGKEVTLQAEQANNNVLATETTIAELADNETVSTFSLGAAEKVHKVVENLDESVPQIQDEKVEESPVLRAAKGMKKSRKKSKLAVENLSDAQMKDHDVGHSTPSLDKTKEMDNSEKVNTSNLVELEKAHKGHEDADDSVQPMQSERTEECLVLPKGKKKSKKKSKHGVEENLSDIQMKDHDMAHSTPSIEKTKVSSKTKRKSNLVETGSENLKNGSTLQSQKVTDDSRQQLNNEVTGSVEAFGDNVIDEKRSEGKNEAIINSERRANDNHDSETESKVGNSKITGRVSRSDKSDKFMPKTPISFHDAFSKTKESDVDKSQKKKSDTGKTLLAITGNFLKDADGVSSDDDGTVDSDATRAPSDYFSSSDESDPGSYILKRKDGGNSQDLMNMDLDAVLKSSVRYKKAKIAASQEGQYDDPLESVPDTQL